MARFQNLPPELFDDIHKHCDPESRLNLLEVSRKFYDWFIQSHLKHVKVVGFQKHVSASLARLLDADGEGHTTKNLRCIQTASIMVRGPMTSQWAQYARNRGIQYEELCGVQHVVDDVLIPRIVSLTTRATGLKFLKLEAHELPFAQDEKFRQMLKQPGKWTIHTLAIRSSFETTLACLDKCDPMQLTGVEIKPERPEIASTASPSNVVEDMGVPASEYKALKAFYKIRDDSENQNPLLKRLFYHFHAELMYPDIIGMVKNTFDTVEFITKDFPNLEWLIIPIGKSDILVPESIEHNLPAWEDLFKQVITKLKETKLVKLAFYIPWDLLETSTGPRRSDSRGTVTHIRVHAWYLRLARRLVESVEGLQDVAIMYKYDCEYDYRCHYRATQSENGTIKIKQVKPKFGQTFYEFPYGLLDTWA